MIDLQPATRTLAAVVDGVRDDQLDGPTPCADTSVGVLLDHVAVLARAFTLAAAKIPREGAKPGPVAGSQLDPEWRTLIPARLDELAAAWRDPAAWTGMTTAGGVDLPGEVAAAVALDEVIVHGWDLAVATGQSYECDPELVAAAAIFVEGAVAENPGGSPGLFGPPVPVAADAPPLHRLLGLTGRDPGWRPPG